MTGLRGVNGVDAKTAGLVRCTGKDFEIQSHAATLYANAARLESRVFGATVLGATCFRTSPLVAVFPHGMRTRRNTSLHATRHFFGVAAGDAAPVGAAVAFTADSSFKVNFQWASAFFSPIFASTMTEQESPCSGCVTW